MKKYVHDLFVDRIESDFTCVVTISSDIESNRYIE